MKFSGKARMILGSVLFLVFTSISCGFMEINYEFLGRSPAQAGIIRIYDFSSGSKGKLLAESSLENGYFKFALNPDQKTFLIELKNFSIFDPFNNRLLFSGENNVWETLAVFPKNINKKAYINLNSMTTIASAFAKFKIKDSYLSSIEKTIAKAGEATGKHFGGLDLPYDIPGGLDARSTTLSNGIKYDLLLLSFFEIGYNELRKKDLNDIIVSNYNIINFTKHLTDDINHDGFLNGIASYGSTPLDGDEILQMLKANLSSSLYRIIQNKSLNRTDLTYANFYDFLNQISTSRADFFSIDSPVYSFDIDPPAINCVKPLNGETISGLFEINCQITDQSPGVKSTAVSINGLPIPNELASPGAFFAFFDSKDIGISPAEIIITSTDKMGNESMDMISITINN